MKDWVTHKDIGKLFRRTSDSNEDVRYLRVRDTESIGGKIYYRCDIVKSDNDVAKDVLQSNLSIYRYEEVSELEVLVVCGVEL